MKVDIKIRCKKVIVRVSLPLIDEHITAKQIMIDWWAYNNNKTNNGGLGKKQKWEKIIRC